MFYDERIEKTKGRIARNVIIMSVIISVVIGAVRLANVLKNTDGNQYLCFVVLEAVIVLGGLICLPIGFIRGKIHIKDERIVSEQSIFYNKASSILIKIVTLVFAFFLPIVLNIGHPNHYTDGGFDSIFLVLFFIVGIYVIYEFRRNDIYFNYSIMEKDHYYRSVFKNIGKLALYILCLFAVSVMSVILFVATKQLDQAILIKSVLQMIALYVGVFIEFSLLYWLYSFLEKTSYNSNCLISKSTVISLSITILIYAMYTFIVTFVDSLVISQTQAIQFVTIASSLGTYINFAFLIFLTYFSYEYQKVKRNKLLSAACITILLSEASAFLIGQVLGGITSLFLREMIELDAYLINQILSTAKTVMQDTSSLANIVGFSLIIIALIRDRTIRKSNLVIIISFAALGGVEIFLRTQTGYLEVNIYHVLAEIAVLLYFCILTARIDRKYNPMSKDC